MGMYCTLRRVIMEKLESYLEDSHKLEQDFFSNEVTQAPSLDIDKAWDGIIFLLTGSSFEDAVENKMSQVILGSASIDENQDLGYGPARYLLPEEVKSLNEKIKAIGIEDLKLRFNPQEMKDQSVYPDIWDEQNSFDYLEEYFVKLQSFFQHASWANEAIVIIIN